MWHKWGHARVVALDVVLALSSIVVLHVDKVGSSALDKLFQSDWELKAFAPNSSLPKGLPEKFKPTGENARVLGVNCYPFSTSNEEEKKDETKTKELAEFNANIFFWLKFAEWLNRVEESLNCAPAEAATEKCPIYEDSAKEIGADLFAAGNAIDESVKAFVETIAGIAHHEFRLITNKALSEEQFKLFGAEIKVNVSVPTTTSAAAPNIASLLRRRKFVVENSPTNNQQPPAGATDVHSHTLPMLAKEAMTYMVIYTAQVLLKDMVYGSWTNLLKAETNERLRKAEAKSTAAAAAAGSTDLVREEESVEKMREAWQVVSSRLFTGYLVLVSNVEHKLELMSYRARLKEAHLYHYAVVGCAGTGSSSSPPQKPTKAHICHHKRTIAGKLLDTLHIPNHPENHLSEEYFVNAIESLLRVVPFTLHLDPSLPSNDKDMNRMLEISMQTTNADDDDDTFLGVNLTEVDYLMTEVGTLKGLSEEQTSILRKLRIFLTKGKDWTVGKLAGLTVSMINSQALSRFRPRGDEANEFTLRLPKHWVWAQVMGMVLGLRAKKSGLEAASLYHNLVKSSKFAWSTEEVMEKLADDPKVRYWVFSLAHFYGILHKMEAPEEEKEETLLEEGEKADGDGGAGGGGGGKWTRNIKAIYEEWLKKDHSHLVPGDDGKKEERKRRRRRKKRELATHTIVAIVIIGIIVVAAIFSGVICGSNCSRGYSLNSNSSSSYSDGYSNGLLTGIVIADMNNGGGFNN